MAQENTLGCTCLLKRFKQEGVQRRATQAIWRMAQGGYNSTNDGLHGKMGGNGKYLCH